MSISRDMDKEDMVHIYNGMLLSHKTEHSGAICRDLDRARDCHTELNKSEREKQISVILHVYGIQKNGVDELIPKGEIETHTQRTNVGTPRGKGEWN